jgi:hypothetical protein
VPFDLTAGTIASRASIATLLFAGQSLGDGNSSEDPIDIEDIA